MVLRAGMPFTPVLLLQQLVVTLLAVTLATGTVETLRKTRITWPPQDREAKVGETVVLRCDVTADPSLELSVRWLFNDKPISFDADPRLVIKRDNSLVITRAVKLDSGVYTCVANTAADSKRASATLAVLDVPIPPEILGVECGEFSALVKWTSRDDNHTPILFYSIQYATEYSRDSWHYVATNIPANDSEFRVSLQPRNLYKFRVAAHNKVGQSPPSEPSRQVCRTNTDVPHKNPERVMARWDDSDNLVISWKRMPPEEHHGRGFFYDVKWRGDFPGPSWTGRQIRDWSQDRTIVSGLYRSKPYRIRVQAYNINGKARGPVKDFITRRGGKPQFAKPTASDIVEAAFVVLAVVPEVIGGMW
ncbi:neuroglian-like [Dermacentor albipictus]|uniref:neuroglian-like n=1 Tax=Dermacentor albipictus TaxID=60249 RepID=UPI0038FC0BE7